MLKTANRYTIDINSLIIINYNLTLCAQLMDYFKITLQKCVQYCFVHATTQLSKIKKNTNFFCFVEIENKFQIVYIVVPRLLLPSLCNEF